MTPTKSFRTVSPKKLTQLKKDIKAAGYYLKKVASRSHNSVLEISSVDFLTLDDRSNLLAILSANKLTWESTSLIGSGNRKSILVTVKDAS